MKKLNVTRKHFNESKYFQEKYGKLQFVSESGKLFKTDKGQILKFRESKKVNEGFFGDLGEEIGDRIDSGVSGIRKFFHGKPKFKEGDSVMLCMIEWSPGGVDHGGTIVDVEWNDKKWYYKVDFGGDSDVDWWPEDALAIDTAPEAGREKLDEKALIEKYPEFRKRARTILGKKMCKELGIDESSKKFSESHAKGEHLYSVIVKKPGGWDGSFQVNAMNGDEALEKARARLGRGSRILRIEDIGEYKAFDSDDYAGFDESSDGGWFDEKYGFLQKDIPEECVMDCSGPGRKDDAVAYWVDELKFYIPQPLIGKAKNYLREFGAWEEEELDQWAETEDIEHQLAQHILWEFCNEVKDEAYTMDGEELEAIGLPDDPSEWEQADWTLFQTEHSTLGLFH